MHVVVLSLVAHALTVLLPIRPLCIPTRAAMAVGVSNFEIADLKTIQAVATKPIAVNQFETHPYYQRQELFDYCTENGIVVTAHSSMGGANNAMKKFHKSPPLTQDEAIQAIAKKHGVTGGPLLRGDCSVRSPSCQSRSRRAASRRTWRTCWP